MKRLILAAFGLCLLAGVLITGSFVAGNAASNDMNQNSNGSDMMTTMKMTKHKKQQKHRRHHRKHRKHRRNSMPKNANTE